MNRKGIVPSINQNCLLLDIETSRSMTDLNADDFGNLACLYTFRICRMSHSDNVTMLAISGLDTNKVDVPLTPHTLLSRAFSELGDMLGDR